MNSKKIGVHIALFTVALIYGANYSIAKSVMPHFIQPFGFICLRVTGAFLFFFIYHTIAIKEKVERSDLLRLFFCAFFGVAANMLFFFKGLNLTSPINASLIMTVTPLVVLGLSAIWLGEKITRLKVVGIVLGMTGAIMQIIDPFGASKEVQGINWLGDFFVLLNATSYAIYLVMVKPLMKKYNALTVVKWTFTFGMIMVWPFGLQQVIDVDWSLLTLNIALSILFVIAGTTIIAYLLNAWSLRFVNSSVVGAYIYLQPVLATLIALVFTDYQSSISTLVYAALIFSGVYLVSVAGKKSY